jgi:hypothetical protein
VIFLADESVDRQIVQAIRRDGYEVISVAETSPGIPDTKVLSRANEAGAVLLTADKTSASLFLGSTWPIQAWYLRGWPAVYQS